MNEPLIVLTGPTAVGKTALSIRLAKAVGGEIISADSMQVYKGMDIGSAKIRPEEMEGVPHYLVDILEPDEDFHIVLFQKLAKEAMAKIRENGHIPILVGGTGFYIQAVTRDIDFTEAEQENSYREELLRFVETEGEEALHARLAQLDPETAASLHPHNVKRVIRALEFYAQNGKAISAHNEEQREKKSPYNLAYFVLNAPRPLLYERIDKRVDQMMAAGLLEEVSGLKAMGIERGMSSMQGLGYKEILDYLDGKADLPETIRIIKRDTRHFAKRQLTWFRREEDALWIEKDQFGYDDDKILAYMLQVLRDKEII